MKTAVFISALCAIAAPALAWEFTPGAPCRLTHLAGEVAVELTYDPGGPLYSISLTGPEGFAPAPVFSMRFDGAMPIQIATDRHQMLENGRTLRVEDSGFGNVLNGLQFNQVATAQWGSTRVEMSLTGAAAPVAAFRACDVSATS